MTTSALYTTNHPQLTLAVVLFLGACVGWLADTLAALIVGAM